MADTLSGRLSSAGEHAVELTAAQRETIHLELGRLLESSAFRTSKRSQRFLRFIVQSMLDGHGEALKERTLAIELFGRPAQFDFSSDASVRVAALEVRRRLNRYYVEAGAKAEVEIVLLLGSYVPEFRFRSLSSHDVDIPAPRVEAHRPRAYWPWVAGGLLVAFASALTWFSSKATPAASLFLDFWRPVLEAPGPAIICLYAPEVYLPRKRGELLATQGRLVEIGDAISAGHIAALLSQFNKEDQTRDVNDVSFAELRRSPAILIGGSMLLTNAAHSKHHFVIEGQEGERVIRERGAPYRTWRAQTPKEGKQTEDYGVATRILDTEPGLVVIIIAGLSDYGTKAAAEFLGTERYLSSALSQLPTDWRTRNVQFVVRTEIIGRTTGPPAVLALHSW